MNERIRELASQLGPIATIGNWGRVEWADNVYPQLGDKLYAAIDLEKFVELIVRECNQAVLEVPCYYKDYRSQIEEAVINDCARAVLEHFGVK